MAKVKKVLDALAKGSDDALIAKVTEGSVPLEKLLLITAERCRDPYALAYIAAMPEAVKGYGDEGVKCQLLYILANLERWSGPLAKAVKVELRKFAGAL